MDTKEKKISRNGYGNDLPEVLTKKRTSETPEILLDKQKGKILFSGRSLPEDARGFYRKIKDWLCWYAKDPKPGTQVSFTMEYFNTASSKMILEILDLIKQIETKDPELTIDWYYLVDDEDMLEAGEDFADMANLDFNFVCYE